jgi:hypothetical protein
MRPEPSASLGGHEREKKKTHHFLLVKGASRGARGGAVVKDNFALFFFLFSTSKVRVECRGRRTGCNIYTEGECQKGSLEPHMPHAWNEVPHAMSHDVKSVKASEVNATSSVVL